MLSDCEVRPTIPTRDLQTARRFYEQQLRLTVEGEDEGGVWYRCGTAGLYLYETEHAGTARHTLCSFESDHVDDDIADLREHGVRFETYDMPGVEWDGDVAMMGDLKGVWFRDVDGNVLGMFQKAPVLAHA